MYFINYAVLCLFIGIYLYFYATNTPMPAFWVTIRVWVSWGFLLWGTYESGRIIVDCIVSNIKGEMSAANALNGLMLAVLNVLPVFLMSIFMLKEGFASK